MKDGFPRCASGGEWTPFAAQAGNLRHENRLALKLCNYHVLIVSQLPRNRKPTIGFSV
jgi:hypothetical protein